MLNKKKILMVIAGLGVSSLMACVNEYDNQAGEGESQLPVAIAGEDSTVLATDQISYELDGSASYDPLDKEAVLSYQWDIIASPEGSYQKLANNTSAKPLLTANMVGVYNISLRVTSGDRVSDYSYVTITAVADMADASTSK